MSMMERGRELKGIVIARRGVGGCLHSVLTWRGWGMAYFCSFALFECVMWYVIGGCDVGVVAETLADMLVFKIED
jgi:hypothetical protein